MKKPTVENLKALVYNFELNIYQKKDALLEFEKLNEYIKELEHQLLLTGVSKCKICGVGLRQDDMCDVCFARGYDDY